MIKEQGHPWIKDINESDSVKGCYLIKGKKLGTTRKGDPFISIILADRTGEIEGKIWERAEEISSLFGQGDVVEVRGHAGSFQGRIQITISGIEAIQEELDPGIFVESAGSSVSEMMASLREILRNIDSIHLKALVDKFLKDRQFVAIFKKAPAAKNFHHNYLGGLLEHTLSVCQMAVNVASHYPQLDRDLLLTGAFLHDIGKIRELEFQLNIDYTDEGRLIGHVVLSTAMVDEKLLELKDFPAELTVLIKHLILSHHGQFEFGSPKRPKFLEAFALHLIDDLDAKINGIGRFIDKDRQEGAWTDFNRLFERFFLKEKILVEEKEPDLRDVTDERQGNLFV